MISDEGRRRAVAELRKASIGAYRHVDALDVIAGSVGVDADGKLGHDIEKETYAALADLIDLPKCMVSDVGDDTEQIYRCSACGEEYCMSDVKPYPWRFCPNCGAEVVTTSD